MKVNIRIRNLLLIKKSLLIMLILICPALFLTGCLADSPDDAEESTSELVSFVKEEKEEKSDQVIKIYYLNAEQDDFQEVSYALPQGDVVENAKQVLRLLSPASDIEREGYRPILGEKVKINGVKLLKNNILNIDFAKSYNQLTAEEEVLGRCAVVKTLIQIEGIDKVSYTIEKKAFLTADGMVVGPMDDSSFLLTEEDALRFQSPVSLYYATTDGKKLTEKIKEITSTESILPEQAALEALLVRTEERDVLPPLPKKLAIQNVQIMNNVCYVDLNDEIIKDKSLVRDEVMVYSMVNTVIALGHAASVEFTINGEKVKTVHDIDNFDQTYMFNYELCE